MIRQVSHKLSWFNQVRKPDSWFFSLLDPSEHHLWLLTLSTRVPYQHLYLNIAQINRIPIPQPSKPSPFMFHILENGNRAYYFIQPTYLGEHLTPLSTTNTHFIRQQVLLIVPHESFSTQIAYPYPPYMGPSLPFTWTTATIFCNPPFPQSLPIQVKLLTRARRLPKQKLDDEVSVWKSLLATHKSSGESVKFSIWQKIYTRDPSPSVQSFLAIPMRYL